MYQEPMRSRFMKYKNLSRCYVPLKRMYSTHKLGNSNIEEDIPLRKTTSPS
jgi:hypothetical protein